MTTPEALDVLLFFIMGKKMKKLYTAFSNKIRKTYDLKQIDLEIIFYLYRHPEASLGEISRKMYLNKGQLSQGISSLKDKGYIRTEKDDNDQRYTYYRLTKKSKNLVSEINKIADYASNVLLDGLSKEQIDVYCSVIKMIRSNINKLEKECK